LIDRANNAGAGSGDGPAAGATQVTRLLRAASAGDSHASAELLPLVYEELRKLAAARLAGEPAGGAGYTLQATALVHEAYLKLVADSEASWSSRGHFFGAAALAMRRLLVDRARTKSAAKHGGGRDRVEIDEMLAASEEPGPERVIALDAALSKLESLSRRGAEVVHLRIFAGLTVEETAASLGVSERTVKEDWRFARAWLRREIGESTQGLEEIA
jgi:RNA polymerase sigma factor (TIGR02999 family)